MFCQKCGKGEQTSGAYCRNCGEYLLDHAKLFGFIALKAPPHQKIVWLKILVALSMLFVFYTPTMLLINLVGANQAKPFTANQLMLHAGFIGVFAFGSVVTLILQIAALCFLFQLGKTVARCKSESINANDFNEPTATSKLNPAAQILLPEADSAQFIRAVSATENSTELLNSVVEPRR